MLKDGSTKNYKVWTKSEYVSLAKKNPYKFMAQSAPEFFHFEDNYFCINKKLQPFITNSAFIRHFKDATDYRRLRFYKERYQNSEEI